jgi:hypothetical protein
MYYIAINNEKADELSYYCRNCGHIDTDIEGGSCILNTEFKKGKQHFDHIVNKYTKLDPTLPRIHNLPCPNKECPTNSLDKKIPREVLYMRYDDNNLKYLYMCCECENIWTQ